MNAAEIPFCALSYGLTEQGVGGGDFGFAFRHDSDGTPKTAAQRYANNNFQTTFVVFPGSPVPQLMRISLAENPEGFAVFLSLQAQLNRKHKGRSALGDYMKYGKGGRSTLPANFDQVSSALRPFGYAPMPSPFVRGLVSTAGQIGSAIQP